MTRCRCMPSHTQALQVPIPLSRLTSLAHILPNVVLDNEAIKKPLPRTVPMTPLSTPVRYAVTTSDRAGSPADRYIARMLKRAKERLGMNAIFVLQRLHGARMNRVRGQDAEHEGRSRGADPLDGDPYLCFPVTLPDGSIYGTLWCNKPSRLARQAEFLGQLADIAAVIAGCAEFGVDLTLV